MMSAPETTETNVGHHTHAAECCMKAAVEHTHAAKAYSIGNPEKAEWHARKADGYCKDAEDHSQKAKAA